MSIRCYIKCDGCGKSSPYEIYAGASHIRKWMKEEGHGWVTRPGGKDYCKTLTLSKKA